MVSQARKVFGAFEKQAPGRLTPGRTRRGDKSQGLAASSSSYNMQGAHTAHMIGQENMRSCLGLD